MLTKKVQYVVVGTLLMLLLGIVYSYSMFRIEIETVLNVNKFLSGIPYMIALFFFSVFMAVGGQLYSKYNTKVVAFAGVILISSGFILTSFATSIAVISITYGVIVGIGIGILYGLPLRIVTQIDFKHIGLVTGIVLLGFGLSPLIFAPLIDSFITSYGLSSTFFRLGIIYFIIMAPLVFILTSRDHIKKNGSKFHYAVIKDKKFINLYILFFLGTFIGLTFIGFTGTIGIELIGIDSHIIAFLLGLFALFNGVGRPLFGFLHDKVGFKTTAILSFTTMIIATVLHYLLDSNVIIFIASFIVFYLNFGGWLSLASATTMELFGKEEYSKTYGLMYTAYGVGALIGNSISGILVEAVGLRSLFLLMSVIAFIGLIYVNIGFKDYQKE